MKQKIVMIAMVLMLPLATLMAQTPQGEGPGRGKGEKFREKVIEMRVNYVKENLGLSDAQNDKFIPVYKDYLQKAADLIKESRAIKKELKDNFEMKSDQELETLLQKQYDQELKQLNLKKEAQDAYKKIIPLKKVAKLQLVEKEFNRTMLRKAAERMRKPGEPPHAPAPPAPPAAPRQDGK
ncbi:MAG: hypothetical protein ACT6QS_04095 [Flavobacteriales bacterium]